MLVMQQIPSLDHQQAKAKLIKLRPQENQKPFLQAKEMAFQNYNLILLKYRNIEDSSCDGKQLILLSLYDL